MCNMKNCRTIFVYLLFIFDFVLLTTIQALPVKDERPNSIHKVLQTDSFERKANKTSINERVDYTEQFKSNLSAADNNIKIPRLFGNKEVSGYDPQNSRTQANLDKKNMDNSTDLSESYQKFDHVNKNKTSGTNKEIDVAYKALTKIINLETEKQTIAVTNESKEESLQRGPKPVLATEQKKDVRHNDRAFALNYSEDADSEVEEPSSRILVTVMKRSSRHWEPWELNTNVCPPSLCTASEESRPRGTGDSNILSTHPQISSLRRPLAGTVFYNGDIVLDAETAGQIYGNSLRLRWKRAATRSSKRLWKDGIVPYTFSDDILPKSKKFIKKAMRHIENNTCIRFRQKKLRDDDYIRFISEPGCWSMVGRVGGEQKVSIGRGCERLGTAIHEISHSLGFWHEQARPDRDKYVKILEENISDRYLPDFKPANKSLVSSRGFPYDYESVMHYSEKAFTNLGEVTIKVIGIGKKLKMKIGQRDALSNLDIAQLREMYKCNDKVDDNVTFCPTGWKKNGRSCYKFLSDLNYQFAAAARYCDSVNSHLLYIETSREDKYIKRLLKKKFPNVSVWRTAGRKLDKGFGWFTGEDNKPKEMEYTKWRKGHPATFSSMALVHDRKANRVRWEGVWLGSAKQYPDHAYPFICERRSRHQDRHSFCWSSSGFKQFAKRQTTKFSAGMERAITGKCIKGNYPDGRDYRGTLDHTIDGITCQKWSSQYPHSHKLLPYPYKNADSEHPDGLGDHNYCRNPSKDRKRRPWCFTDKRKYKWQYCDVSICSKQSTKDKPSKVVNSKYSSNKKNTGYNSINQRKNNNSNKKNRINEIQRDQNVQRDKQNNKFKSDSNRKNQGRYNNDNKRTNKDNKGKIKNVRENKNGQNANSQKKTTNTNTGNKRTTFINTNNKRVKTRTNEHNTKQKTSGKANLRNQDKRRQSNKRNIK